MVEDAAQVVAQAGATVRAFGRIGDLLRRLSEQPDLLSQASMSALHGSGSTFTILAEASDGSVLMFARFPSEAPTPVHNHNSWGVARVIKGRDRHILWRRTDDGSKQGRAELEVVDDRVLEVGDWVFFGPPPDDIHSQQGVEAEAIELVYFGRNPTLQPRLYFDPILKTVEERAST
jgi:predicted metal-dependent enzyme (double-stranded beta helix superfamily)